VGGRGIRHDGSESVLGRNLHEALERGVEDPEVDPALDHGKRKVDLVAIGVAFVERDVAALEADPVAKVLSPRRRASAG